MKKKAQRTAKPVGVISRAATELKQEAREQGSKLGAKLLYSASELGLTLLHKATASKSKVSRRVQPVKKTKKSR